MFSLNQNTLSVFAVMISVIFLWGFVRHKDWTRFQLTRLRSSLAFIVISTMFFAVTYVASGTLGLPILCGLPFFLGSFILPFILSELNMQPFLRSLIYTAGAVALTLFLPKSGYEIQLASAIAGLCVWKAASNLGNDENATLIDFLPPFVWLSGSFWIVSSGAYAKPELQAGILLSTIGTAIFMRWVQSPLLWEDPEYLKRTVLSITGGLTLLVVITKLLLIDNFARIAGLGGIGFFACYVLETLARDNKPDTGRPKDRTTALDVMKQLALIGALTLLGSRMFGCEGLLVLSACAIISARSGIVQVVGVFWALRVLQQAYTSLYSSNITGININHEYAGAALYLGFVVAFCAASILQDIEKKVFFASYKSWLFSLGSFFVAVSSSYLLHAEPTGSLMISTVVASIIFSVAGKSLFSVEKTRAQTLILFPASLISFGLVFNGLIDIGNTASVQQRIYVVATLGVVLLIASVVSFARGGGFKRQAVQVATD